MTIFLTEIVVQEPPPASTDSSDDQMSDSTESSIQPGSPSPPPPALHPLIPIKLEKEDHEENKGEVDPVVYRIIALYHSR